MESTIDNSANIKRILDKLFSFNINTPEIILYLLGPLGPKDVTIVKGVTKAIVGHKVSTVLRIREKDPIVYMDQIRTKETLDAHDPKNSILIFKAPKSKIVNMGVCSVEVNFAKISIYGRRDDSIRLAWNDKLEGPNAELFHKVTRTLGPFSKELDGLEVVFTEHDKPEGVLGDKLVFWGV